METKPALQLQAVLKSMTDVILPALDPDNAMAQEQGQLAVAMLQFVLRRLPKEFDYACAELQHFTDLGDRLAANADLPTVAESELTALRQCVAQGNALLDSVGASTDALQDAARDLRTRIGTLTAALDLDSPTGKKLAKLTVDAAQSQVERERAWLAPLGVEWDPNVPDLEALIARADSH